jgi:hypothetical protein
VPADPTTIQLYSRKRRRPREAEQFIADWSRIVEVAHQHALKGQVHQSYLADLTSSPTRKRREHQLRKGERAAHTAIAALSELVEVVDKYTLNTENFNRFRSWADSVGARLWLVATLWSRSAKTHEGGPFQGLAEALSDG